MKMWKVVVSRVPGSDCDSMYSSLRFVMVLMVVGVFVVCARGVERSDFKQCSDLEFCRRNTRSLEDRKNEFEVRIQEGSVRHSDNDIQFMVTSPHYRQDTLRTTITSYKNGIVRVQITDENKKRYVSEKKKKTSSNREL